MSTARCACRLASRGNTADPGPLTSAQLISRERSAAAWVGFAVVLPLAADGAMGVLAERSRPLTGTVLAGTGLAGTGLAGTGLPGTVLPGVCPTGTGPADIGPVGVALRWVGSRFERLQAGHGRSAVRGLAPVLEHPD